MSTDNMSEQEPSVTRPEPVAVADDRNEPMIEYSHMQFNVSDEFAEIYKSCHAFMAKTIEPKDVEEINVLSLKLDSLYNRIINEKVPIMDDIVTLAESYLSLSYKYPCEGDEEIILVESWLQKCIKLIKKRELDRKCILTAVDAYHYLGIFYNKKNNELLCWEYWENALQLYLNYTKGKDLYCPPCDFRSYFNNKHSSLKDIDVILLLDYKSIVNMKSLVDFYMQSDQFTVQDEMRSNEIVRYQHYILKRVLNHLSPEIDYFAWIIVLGSLCTYFINGLRFTEARDHLRIASFMLQKFRAMIMKDSNDPVMHKKFKNPEMFKRSEHLTVIVAEYWAKYGIELLRKSHERHLFGAPVDCALCDLDYTSESERKLLIFDNIEKNVEEYANVEYAHTIPDTFASSYAEAHIIFTIVIKILEDAKDFCRRYMKIVDVKLCMSITLSISQIYKYFIFYVNTADKLALYKQRLTILLDTLNNLMGLKSNVCIWPVFCETVIAVNETLDAMREIFQTQCTQIKESTNVPDKMLNEINKILKKSMEMLKKYRSFAK